MPHIKASRPISARVVHITSQQIIESFEDEVGDGGEEARVDEEKGDHGDEKGAQRGAGSEEVDEEAAKEVDEGGNEDGDGGLAEGDTEVKDETLRHRIVAMGGKEGEDGNGRMRDEEEAVHLASLSLAPLLVERGSQLHTFAIISLNNQSHKSSNPNSRQCALALSNSNIVRPKARMMRSALF